jgi:hypothetical protein
MRTEEFFEAVYHCRLSDLDTYNQVKEMTNSFEPKLLNMLCDDFDFYFFMKDEEMLGEVSHEEIQKKVHKYEENDRKVPMLSDRTDGQSVSNYFKSTKHKFFKVKDDAKFKANREKIAKEIQETSENSIDVERLMYPTKFYCLYKLRNLLIDLKRKHTSAIYRFDDEPKPQIANSQHINWLESDESLEQFINALQEQSLIQSVETEAIIQEHFKPQRAQNSKYEPILWLETIALLAYMIESLDQQYIKPQNIWSDTAPHFSKNGQTPKNLRQTSNRFKQNKSGKPKNYKLIDNIIKSLSD